MSELVQTRSTAGSLEGGSSADFVADLAIDVSPIPDLPSLGVEPILSPQSMIFIKKETSDFVETTLTSGVLERKDSLDSAIDVSSRPESPCQDEAPSLSPQSVVSIPGF